MRDIFVPQPPEDWMIKMLLFAAIVGENPQKARFRLDEKLIERIGKGDAAAFKDLYDGINKTLFAYILSIVRNFHDSEDILHETYLKIRAAAHLYQPQGKPMAWIFTIARNLSLMHLRKNKPISEFSMDDLENNKNFSDMMDEQDKVILTHLLSELEETERSIVLLHAVSGFKHHEIAKSLSLPLATVLSKYHRSLKKLRKRLEFQKAAVA